MSNREGKVAFVFKLLVPMSQTVRLITQNAMHL